MGAKYEISQVTSRDALAEVRTLFEEYWKSFGFTPCFQNFTEELAGLPGAYAPPQGRLAVARVKGVPAGCIALRQVDGRRAEAKRLYMRPEYRGLGLGRGLLQWVAAEARAMGCSEIIGDSMPVMREALTLYRRIGFEVGEPNPADGTNPKIDLRWKL